MASSQQPGNGGQPIAIGDMKIRDLGNSIGITLDRGALEELGVVDDDGNLTDEIYARQIVRDDGRIEISMNLDDDRESP